MVFPCPIFEGTSRRSMGPMEFGARRSKTERHRLKYGWKLSFQMVTKPALSGMILGNNVVSLVPE